MCVCWAGLFGQFHEYVGYPKFPDDRHILGICVAGYMVCSCLLTVLAMGWEQDFIMFCKGGVAIVKLMKLICVSRHSTS